MPNMGAIELIVTELSPFEIRNYVLLSPVFQKWRPLSSYGCTFYNVPKNNSYLKLYVLLRYKITTKFTRIFRGYGNSKMAAMVIAEYCKWIISINTYYCIMYRNICKETKLMFFLPKESASYLNSTKNNIFEG